MDELDRYSNESEQLKVDQIGQLKKGLGLEEGELKKETVEFDINKKEEQEKPKEEKIEEKVSIDSLSIKGFGMKENDDDEEIINTSSKQQKKEGSNVEALIKGEEFVPVNQLRALKKDMPNTMKEVEAAAAFFQQENGNRSAEFRHAQEKVIELITASKAIGVKIPDDILVQYYEAREAVFAYLESHKRMRLTIPGAKRKGKMETLLKKLDAVRIETKIDKDIYHKTVSKFMENSENPAQISANVAGEIDAALKNINAMNENGEFIPHLMTQEKMKEIIDKGSIPELFAVILQVTNQGTNSMGMKKDGSYMPTPVCDAYAQLVASAFRKLSNSKEGLNEVLKYYYGYMIDAAAKLDEEYRRIIAAEKLNAEKLSDDDVLLISMKLAQTSAFNKFDSLIGMSGEIVSNPEMAPMIFGINDLLTKNPALATLKKARYGNYSNNISSKLKHAAKSKDERVKKAYKELMAGQQIYTDYQIKIGYTARVDKLTEAVAKEYDINQKVEEFIRDGRIRTNELVFDTKDGGDSHEMNLVKTAVSSLETKLAANADVNEELLDDISLAYQIAITNSRNYLDKRHPGSDVATRRWNLVNDKYENLIAEAKRFESGRKLIEKDAKLLADVYSPMDVVKIGDKNFKLTNDPRKEINRKNMTNIQSLTLEDFMALVGSLNRGKVVFKNGKLEIVDNGYFKSKEVVEIFSKVLGSDDVETVANVQIRERLFALIQEKYKDQLTEVGTTIIQKELDLDGGKTTAGGLDRKSLKKVFEIIRDNFTLVKKIVVDSEVVVDAGKKVEKEEIIELDENKKKAKDARVEIARCVSAHLYYDDLGLAEKKKLLSNILKKAKDGGVRVPSLGEHEIDNLVINLGYIRDEVFDKVQQIYKYMSVFNNGANGEFIKLVDMQNTAIMDKVTGYVVSVYLAESRELKETRKVQLEEYLKTCAFDLLEEAGVLTQNQVKTLKEDRTAHDISMLSDGGSDGLQEEVDKRLANNSAWERKKKEVQKGTKALTALCDMLSEFDSFAEMAEKDGLTSAEADMFMVLGEKIQKHMTGEGNALESMELVASQLEGTRFKKGFEKIKKLVLNKEGNFRAYAKGLVEKVKSEDATHTKTEKTESLPTYIENFTALNASGQDILRVFMLERDAHELTKEPNDMMANSIVNVMYALRGIPMNGYVEREVEFGNEKIKLIQLADNSLNVVIQNRPFDLPKNAIQIAEHFEADVMKYSTIYGDEYAKGIFKNLPFGDVSDGVLMHSRDMCIKYLSGISEKPDTYFSNLSTSTVREFTDCIMKGTLTVKKMLRMVKQVEGNVHFNGQENIELLEKIAVNKQKVNYVRDVVIPVQENKAEKEYIEVTDKIKIPYAEWTEEEVKAKDLVADLVLPSETWEMDKGISDIQRIANTLDKHFDTIIMLLNKPEILLSMFEKMNDDMKDTNNDIQKSIEEFLADPMIQDLKTIKNIPVFGDFLQNGAVRLALISKRPAFAKLDAEINKQVKSMTDSVQDMITEKINGVMTGELNGGNQAPIGDPNQKGISKDEKKARIDAGNNRLNDIMKNTFKGGSGQGLFVKNVMKNYFKNVSVIDQRSMIASAIRYAKPKTEIPKDIKLTVAQENEVKSIQAGRYLGGLIKGAGPLLQKMMQGMPTEGMPTELVTALKDIKSKLSPIPKEIVEAQMHNIVTSSKGKITSIEIVKALGAASVAQTFLCKMYGPGMGDAGKEVAIKILRPEVKNRMAREKQILLDAARLTDKMQKEAEEAAKNPQNANAANKVAANAAGQAVKQEDVVNLINGDGNAENNGAMKEEGPAEENKEEKKEENKEEKKEEKKEDNKEEKKEDNKEEKKEENKEENKEEKKEENKEENKEEKKAEGAAVEKKEEKNVAATFKTDMGEYIILENEQKKAEIERLKNMTYEEMIKINKTVPVPEGFNNINRADYYDLKDEEKEEEEKVKVKEGAMEATYNGQLKRIEEEMDLRIEARNAQRGLVYDRGFEAVKSVVVDSTIEPTVNTMVLEKADGETLDTYLENIDNQINGIISKLVNMDGDKLMMKVVNRKETKDPAMKSLTSENVQSYLEAQRTFPELLKQLQLRQEHMTKLVDMWVREGVFGEGFYHGDLHAGNIMIDDKGVTLIDFGNATQLNEMQREEVLRMMIAAACGDYKIFLSSFEKLLEKTSAKDFAEKKDKLKAIFKEVLRYGDAKSSGLRIAAALMKAQEIGVELPPAIYNFSQSQLRLQNALDEMNVRIKKLQAVIRGLPHVAKLDARENDLYVTSQNCKEGDKTEEYKKLINQLKIYEAEEEAEIREKLYGDKEEDIKAFEENYMPSEINLAIIHSEFIKYFNLIQLPESYENGKLKPSLVEPIKKVFAEAKPLMMAAGIQPQSIEPYFTGGYIELIRNQELKKAIDPQFEPLIQVIDRPEYDYLKKYKAFRDAQKAENADKQKIDECANAFITSFMAQHDAIAEGDNLAGGFLVLLPETEKDVPLVGMTSQDLLAQEAAKDEEALKNAQDNAKENAQEQENAKREVYEKIARLSQNEERERRLKIILAEWEASKDKYGAEYYEELESAVNGLFDFARTRINWSEDLSDEQKAQYRTEKEQYDVLLLRVKRAYRKGLIARFEYESRFRTDLTYDDREPDDFANAMGSIIEAHVASSVAKLGVKGVWRNFKVLSEILNKEQGNNGQA